MSQTDPTDGITAKKELQYNFVLFIHKIRSNIYGFLQWLINNAARRQK